jgi:hypothetical protein
VKSTHFEKNQPLAQRIIHPASTNNNPGQKSSQAITPLKEKNHETNQGSVSYLYCRGSQRD